MNKSKIAVAVAMVAAAASSGVMAQNVTFYGRANLGFDQYQAGGASAGDASSISARSRVYDSGSRFGIRVNEDLGGGLRAFVTCETGMNIDRPGQLGQSAVNANSATNDFCSREGHVGIGNNALELRLGYQNVYWTHGELNQTGANFLGADVLGAFYASGAGAGVAVFSRQRNTILVQANQGLGPLFSGSHVWYSTEGGENRGSTAATTAGQNTNTSTTQAPRSYGFKLNFNDGPLVGMVDYAKQDDATGRADLATNYDHVSWKAAAGYKYAPGSIVSVTYWDFSRTYSLAASKLWAIATALQGPSAAADVRGDRVQRGYGLNVQHNLGNGLAVYGQYAVMADAKANTGLGTQSIADTGATAWMVGARKDLSKRTGIYGATMMIKNEANNSMNFAAGGYSPTSARGADPVVTQVGIMHNF